MTPPEPFDDFYRRYLTQHAHPANRACHLAAKVAAAGALGAAVADRSVAWLVAAPVLAVGPCWLAHWLFEGNRPTAFAQPSASLLGTLAGRFGVGAARRSRGGRADYSLRADLRMCRNMLLRRPLDR